MKRLTTETPDGNFETILNFVYGRYGWAYIRHDGENADVPLAEWARKQCLNRGCDEFPAESAEEIDQEICDCMMDSPDCPVALSYCFASQAVHLRDRLKRYEEILFAEDGTELISLEQLRTMVSQLPNPPLTLEELRDMDGAPVWVKSINDDALFAPKGWAIVAVRDNGDVLLSFLDEDAYRQTWVLSEGSDEGADDEDEIEAIYRRKPEEGSHTPAEPSIPDWAGHLHSRFMRRE